MQKFDVLEVTGIRVLTTKQIAEAYGVKKDKIIYNFNYNKKRYQQGKHYIELTGDELRRLKTTCENQMSLKYAKSLYLWTEKGALLHAKSLNTDKAWEVYDYLVDFYFRAKERGLPLGKPQETKPAPVEKPVTEQLPYIANPLRALKDLLYLADMRGIQVGSCSFECVDGRLHNNRIGIRNGMTLEKVVYELAWELAHAFIHYKDGNLIQSPLSKDYNEQATRAADMLIKTLNVKTSQY